MTEKVTVFLSSVSQGLEPYREAVYRAIEGLDGYHCSRMEDFGSRNASSEAVCHQKISESRIFVGILSHQYGSICSSGKSYTEVEYDIACESGMQRLMFLAPEDFPVCAHLIESDSVRERQRLFRKRVMADRQVGFFGSEDELGRMVLQAISNCSRMVNEQLHPMQEPVRMEATNSAMKDETLPKGKTWLLFPYMTNLAGFDTGFSIANISASPTGTKPEAGTVVLHFYGTDTPKNVVMTTPLGSGSSWANTISIIAPKFQGYMIAECNFQPGRGFAMVSDAGARNLAAGYLAEVMDQK